MFMVLGVVPTLLLGAVGTEVPAYAAGTPGVPQAPIVVFSEDFGGASLSTPMSLRNYPTSASPRYTADTPWLPPLPVGSDAGPQIGACNGWILNYYAAQPDMSVDFGCTIAARAMWTQLRNMAKALGVAQGMSTSDANYNNVLSAASNRLDMTQVAGTMLKNNANLVTSTLTTGRFYGVSAYFAALNCRSDDTTGKQNYVDPSLRFYLMDGGTAIQLANGLNPCTAAGDANGIHTMRLNATPVLLGAGTHQLGMQLYNATATGIGNDAAFDLPMIVDMTPQLDQVFNPSVVPVGGSSVLTYTVTNTTDLLAKNGWSFSAPLPDGLVLTAGGTPTTTCSGGQVSVTGGVITGSGNLKDTSATPAASPSCTFSVPVTATANGVYTMDPSAVTLNGLLTPLSTTLVTTQLHLDGTVAPDPAAAGQTVTYTFTVTNTGIAPISALSLSAAGTTPDDSATGFTGAESLSAITCDATSLDAGASTTCHASYTVTTDDVAAGQIDLTALASGVATGPAGDTAAVQSNYAPVPLTIQRYAKVTKAAYINGSPDAENGLPGTPVIVYAGYTITYSITAENVVSDAGVGTIVEDPVPDGLLVDTSSLPVDAHYDATTRVITWDLSDRPDGSTPLEFTTTVKASGDYDNTAEATYHDGSTGKSNTTHHRMTPVLTTLTVSKTVAGDYGDRTKAFDFTLTLHDKAGMPVSGSFGYVVEPIGGGAELANGTLTLVDGSAPFSLVHGQKIMIQNVSDEYSVQIKETPVLSYSTSFVDSDDPNTVNAGNDTTMTRLTVNRVFDFTNERETVAPTGIDLSNTQSIIGLIIVACLATAAVVAVTLIRRRNGSGTSPLDIWRGLLKRLDFRTSGR